MCRQATLHKGFSVQKIEFITTQLLQNQLHFILRNKGF